ncbi:unnamed protein product [Trichobilharzia szidati]|nr:unnamed protein product [Trichobilharzia szidati]
MKKLGFRFWKVKMNKLSRHKVPGITPEEQLLTRYIFLTGLMIFITMIITICIATITTIRRKYADNYIPVMYFFIGIIPILVLILVKKLQYLYPLNYILSFLTVLLWSLELPVLTTFMRSVIFIPWTLAVVIAWTLVIIGHTRKVCETASLTALAIAIGLIVLGALLLIPLRLNGYGAAGCIFCAACVMLAVSLGLFLTGQCLKLISSLKMAQIVLLWFPFITWIQVIIFFFSICAIYICI